MRKNIRTFQKLKYVLQIIIGKKVNPKNTVERGIWPTANLKKKNSSLETIFRLTSNQAVSINFDHKETLDVPYFPCDHVGVRMTKLKVSLANVVRSSQ